MKEGLLKAQDVVRLLRRDVERAGGQSEWARRTGTDRTSLNKVLRGSRPASSQIIKALELKEIVVCGGPDANSLLPLLRQAVSKAGSISAWARQTGINRATISLVIHKKRAPSARFFRVLKQKKITAYLAQES
jgi:DNA-binding phage protein